MSMLRAHPAHLSMARPAPFPICPHHSGDKLLKAEMEMKTTPSPPLCLDDDAWFPAKEDEDNFPIPADSMIELSPSVS